MLKDVSETIAPTPLRTGRTRRAGMEHIARFIDANFADRLTLDELAARAGLSVFRFVTVFRKEVGVSPHRYLCKVRVQAAQSLLRTGVRPSIAATEVGFFDQSHLCRHFRAVCGMTPGQYLATPAQPGALS